ncbi:hypothetical protein BCR44DRAFT_1437449 [Catenaria anguillulae PL171]|uniref:Uncharacterized protein n=1 Tax=Catenaria anguillulae PL171 TaxID=765915 RepID=A0A1Y2HJ54_9FUNG|nr:hypothetical protein BCR44DRAFT_1437449 [Catenaria anguillulae PL171]
MSTQDTLTLICCSIVHMARFESFSACSAQYFNSIGVNKTLRWSFSSFECSTALGLYSWTTRWKRFLQPRFCGVTFMHDLGRV